MKLILSMTELLVVLPYNLIYLWAADQFCKKYLEITKKKELLFAVILFSSRMLLEIVNQHHFIPYVVMAFLSHVILMGSVLALFQGDIEKKILVSSILITIRSLTADFCQSLFSCLALVWLHTAGHIAVPFLSERASVVISWASFMIVILVLHGISEQLVSVLDSKPGKWYLVLAVPLLVITMTDNVAGWGASNGIMVRSGGNMGLYYDQIFSHTEFCVLTALSMFAAGFYVFGMNRIYLEQEKSSQYHAKIAAYQMLTEQYSQSERLRHDMKNHIIALSGLFQNREWEKMGDYLNHMEAKSLEKGADLTGNQAVDALLYQKRQRAERKHVKWECEVRIPKACGIREFDLCVLFGNLLDNALEACERQQCSGLSSGECCYIDIQAKMIKKCFLLEVKNSMGRMETYEEGVTVKENPREHGIGMLNVRNVVREYHGVMNIEAGNGAFSVSILIPLQNAVYDIRQAV